jgi:hypothetical protein
MQPIWPFPGLYLVEVISLTWVGAWILTRAGTCAVTVACAIAGALAGFSILGAWSIGLYYLPVVLLSALAGGMAAWRMRLSGIIALASFAVGCAGQIALMLAVLRLLPSLTIFAAVIRPRWSGFPVRGRGRAVRFSKGGRSG